MYIRDPQEHGLYRPGPPHDRCPPYDPYPSVSRGFQPQLWSFLSFVACALVRVFVLFLFFLILFSFLFFLSRLWGCSRVLKYFELSCIDFSPFDPNPVRVQIPDFFRSHFLLKNWRSFVLCACALLVCLLSVVRSCSRAFGISSIESPPYIFGPLPPPLFLFFCFSVSTPPPHPPLVWVFGQSLSRPPPPPPELFFNFVFLFCFCLCVFIFVVCAFFFTVFPFSSQHLSLPRRSLPVVSLGFKFCITQDTFAALSVCLFLFCCCFSFTSLVICNCT